MSQNPKKLKLLRKSLSGREPVNVTYTLFVCFKNKRKHAYYLSTDNIIIIVYGVTVEFDGFQLGTAT